MADTWSMGVAGALMVVTLAVAGPARAYDDDAPLLWGITTVELISVGGAAAIFAAGGDDTAYAVGLSVAISLAIGAGTGAYLLSADGNLSPTVPAMAHFGLWSGGATLLLMTLAQDDLTPVGWSVALGAAAAGSLLGLLVDREDEAWWSLVLPPAGAGLWFAATLVGGFVIAFGPDDDVRTGYAMALPILTLGGVLVASALAAGSDEPTARHSTLRVSPFGLSLTF